MGLTADFCQERLITTESATAPVAAVVEVADCSSTPVGTVFVGRPTANPVLLAVLDGWAAFLGVADLGGRPAFFLGAGEVPDATRVVLAFLGTDLTAVAFLATVFFGVFFFLAAALAVDAFLSDVFLLLMNGIIATL